MEHQIQLHVEKLPEGVYLATSEEVQSLVAQGRTIQEAIELACDIAKKLIELQDGACVRRAKSLSHQRLQDNCRL